MKKFKKVIFLACFVMLIAVMAIAISAAAPESIALNSANLKDQSGKTITIGSVVGMDETPISTKEEEDGTVTYTLPLFYNGKALSYYLDGTVLTATLTSDHFTKDTSDVTSSTKSKVFVIINFCDSNFDDTTTTPNLSSLSGKTKLVYVWLNDSTKAICKDSFKSTALIEIAIPSSVTSIGSSAFSDCKRLTKANIPSGVTEIKDYIFNNCFLLTDLKIDENENIKTIENSAFNGCKSLKSIDLLKFPALTKIGDNAFRNAFTLDGSSQKDVTIEIPATVTIIDNYAFNNCKRITKVIFPRDLEKIGSEVFVNYDKKDAVADFSKCTKDITIGAKAFCNSKFTTINLGPTKVTLDTETGSISCNSLSTVIMSYKTFANLGANAFNSGKNTTFYIVGGPDGITDRATIEEITGLRESAIGKENNGKLSEASTLKEYDKNTTYSGKTIVYNYNLCMAFHGKVHTLSKTPVLAYKDGFDKEGTSANVCTRNCGYCENETKLKPIFTALGYSTKNDGTAIYAGFTVNTEALSEYNKYTTKPLKYGIIISNVTGEDVTDISFTGNIINGKSIQVEINDTSFSRFGFTLTGFTTTELKALDLVISAYVIETTTDAEGNATESMSFVQQAAKTDLPEGVAYYIGTVTVNSDEKKTLGVMSFDHITALNGAGVATEDTIVTEATTDEPSGS